MHARISAFLVVFALALASLAVAQETTTGTISGRILDAQGLAVPGATVTVTGPQGARTDVTDTDGRFNLPFLTPGVYNVRAELQGFRVTEQQNIAVSLGQRLDLNLRMEVGALTETVQVTGTSPVIDTASTTVGAVLSSELLNRVPVGRKMTDALYLAPGVSSGGEVGKANPSIGGGSGLENQYIVDGINITNTGYGAIGSYSIVFGSLGSGVTFDFVKEIQVKTGGYEAEFGQSSGGVVNVITKSGANSFAGSLFSYFRPEALEGNYETLNLVNGTQIAAQKTASRVNDVGFEVGGPIMRDRIFFFGAVNPQWERDVYKSLPIFPLVSLGEINRDRRTMTYSGKVTLQASSSHRFDASFFGDPAKGDEGPQRTAAFRRADTKGFSAIEYGGHNQIVKYDGILSNNFLLEGAYARAQNKILEIPSVDEWMVTDRTVTPNIASGGLGFFEANDGTNQQYALKATGIFGDHQLRGGIGIEKIDYLQGSNRTGPPITTHDGKTTKTGAQIQILAAPEVPGGKIWRVIRSNFDDFRETKQDYFNFFVQDTFRAGNRLTIRPGIRYEQQKLVGNIKEFTWDGNWAPRIGVTYDPTGAGRAKIFGNWGRFFAKIPNDLAARALSADAGVTRGDYFDAALTRPIPTGTLAAATATHYTTAGLAAADFDPDSKSTYLDEILFGAEFDMRGVNLGARYIHRNFGRVLEDVGTAPMMSYFLPQFASQLGSVEYFITNPGPNTPVILAPPGFNVSFEKPIHDYDALEFSADKRFADRWGLQASYRWSRLFGTFEGFFRNDNGQSDPAISSLYDFPTNDPSYVALGRAEGFKGDIRFLGDLGAGPLPNDRPHQFKTYGNYSMDNGLNFGIGLNIGSGQPLTALAANPDYVSAGEIPETPRGEGFQTQDGFKTRTPMESALDFHADYALQFGGQRLTLLADIFNLTDMQKAVNYDHYTQSSFPVSNPDFGKIWRYQTPRQIRLGLRFAF